jgi:putative hemolysin
LIAGNAFFVVGEYAIVTARRGALRSRGGMGAASALRLMDDPVRVISTVQVGITAIGILTGAIGEPLVRDLLGDWSPAWLGFVIAFGIVTYLSVVFGELVPKALTLDRAETLAALVAPPIELLAKALRPVVWVLQGSARLLLRPFGITEVVAGETIRSPEELRALVDEAEGAGVIPRAQEELLHNVFDFASREVRDVMVPAPDVVWLDASLPASRALELATAHQRFPVGEGSLDRVVGVVHLRDLLEAGDRTVGELARPFHAVPPTKDLAPLLRELRERRQGLAIVVDEYGDTAGIVTLHDVLEEIVGDIESEFDLPSNEITRIDEQTVDVSGAMSIDDFNETFGTDLPTDDDARTLAGLTFAKLGRRPRLGDTVRVGALEIRVEEVRGLRITRLRIRFSAPL